VDFLPHPLAHTVEERRASAENDVLKEILPDVHVALLHRVVAVFVDALYVKASDLGVEHYFGSSESLISDQDLSAVRQFIVLFARVGGLGFFESLVKIVHDIAHFFLDVPYYFQLSVSGELVTSLV